MKKKKLKADVCISISSTDAAEFATISAEMMPYVKLLEMPQGINLSQATPLGALGVPGLSAYLSFYKFVPEPRAGKTLWVWAASGAVDQLVGQIAKMHGMKVIGITGSDEKVEFVTKEPGFDAAWNYQTEKTADALTRVFRKESMSTMTMWEASSSRLHSPG